MPDKEKEPFSMYDKMREHDTALSDHGERLTSLEESDRRQEARIKLLEDNAIRLENTVMSEARETRSTMERNTDRLFGIVHDAMAMSTTQEAQRHELKLTKWDKVSTILLKIGGGLITLAGSGGALYYVFVHFFGGGE